MKHVLDLAVLLVAILVGVAGVATFIVTRPPAPVNLRVKDGSTVGVIEWNLTSMPGFGFGLNFAAMTYANETNSATSSLTLTLHTWTLWDGGCECLQVNVNASAVGAFASNLRPANVQLWANQTGPNGTLDSWPTEQYGTNVSFDPGQSIGFYTGSAAVSATVMGGAYRISYSDRFEVWGGPQNNRFVGLRATVTGPFVPAVSVGILREVINTSGGAWA